MMARDAGSVEESGRSVDDAVQRALRRLGRSRREVDVEVLEEGRSGILGVGQTPARVRVTPTGGSAGGGEASKPLPRIDDYEDPTELEPGEGRRSQRRGAEREASGDEGTQPDHRGRAARRGGGRPVLERGRGERDDEESDEQRGSSRRGGGQRGGRDRGRGREVRQSEPREPLPPFELLADPEFEPNEDAEQFSIEVLRDLTRLMGFDVEITAREPETPMDGLGHSAAVLDVRPKEGDDLGLLIGRHGSHISALQYVVNVILSRALDGDHPVTVDVDGYRRRREEALHDIARRAAEEVREYGEPVTLASMPPAERRIIHLALMDSPDLETESEGTGPSRRVRILLRDD